MPEELLHMGQISHAHGIKGEIAINWDADTPFSTNMPLLIRKPGEPIQSITVTGMRRHQGRLLLSVEGIDNRNAAEDLSGAELLMPRSMLPAPAGDEIYAADLPGMAVFLEDGRKLGCIESVDFISGKMVWNIKSDTGAEILFPAEPCFIASFDLARRRTYISPPAGLLDIYLA